MKSGSGVPAPEDPTLLAPIRAAGFARASLELQWRAMRFDDPTAIDGDARAAFIMRLRALGAAGLRPFVVLHSWETAPCPMRAFSLDLRAPAARGSTTLEIDPAQVDRVKPRRSGLAASIDRLLFTEVDAGGRVTLSRPLDVDLAAGAHPALELAFEPFGRARLADGGPNPAFEATLTGFTAYVTAVVEAAREALPDETFDIAIGNELVAGAAFLDLGRYHATPHPAAPESAEATAREIVRRALAALQAASLGPRAGGMNVVNGFASTSWSFAASTEPPDVSALARNVVSLARPRAAPPGTTRSLDPRGAPSGVRAPDGVWQEAFTPEGHLLFPEAPLTAILPLASRRPGQLMRDLAPIATTDANGVVHGRVPVPGRTSPLPIWITAINTNPSAHPEMPNLSKDDLLRLQAKAAMRALSAYLNKGSDALFFYTGAAAIELVDHGAPNGGFALAALERFHRAFAEAQAEIRAPRSLRLESVRGCGEGQQIDGDGTTAHPPLVDRELVAFFPFQIDERRFVAATYVMSQDLLHRHAPQASAADATRFDRPETAFDLVLEGVSEGSQAELYDPLLDRPIAVAIRGRSPGRLVLSVPLTDSVRLLTIREP